MQRQAVEGDRRKTELLCTPKAQPVIEKGRGLQQDFMEHLLFNMDDNKKNELKEITHIMEQNLDTMLKGDK